MTAVQTFEDLQSTLETSFQGFLDDLYDELDRIVDMLNGAAGSVADFISFINPFDSDTIDHAIDKWNDEILPETEKRIGELIDEVWDAVGDLAGRPMDLLDYSHAFNDVKAQIYTEGDMSQKLVLLTGSWSGFAFDNYKAVATTQDGALRDFSLAMDAGATLTSAAANQILNLWRRLVNEFLSWGADLLGLFSKATSADSILSFEVPEIFAAAQVVWQNIIDLGDILVEFLIEQATTGATSWQQLANGARGIPQNKWPMVEEGNSDVINDPGQWAPTA
jgi:hypothetical protein